MRAYKDRGRLTSVSDRGASGLNAHANTHRRAYLGSEVKMHTSTDYGTRLYGKRPRLVPTFRRRLGARNHGMPFR
jgi:hypothetical protein